jgi:pyocin large subunit-like protein
LNNKYSFLALVGLLAVLAAARFLAPELSALPTLSGHPGTAVTWDEPVWTGGISNAEHHWQKHGGEFPEFATRDAYIAGAHAFIDRPPPGTLTKERDNGDTLFYNPGSNTFAVRAPNGAPRTFFRPDSGMAYWGRQ